MATKRKSRKVAGSEPSGIGNGDAAPWHWPALTGLRGIAALAVFSLHAYQLSGRPEAVPPPLAWLFAMGGSGVDVFFVLSAFLLTLPYLRGDAAPAAVRPAWRQYALRRIARVVPAYYVQVALLLVLGALGVGGAMAWSGATWPPVLAHVAFWLDAWPLVPPHVPSWWTLPVEMGFYLLLPGLTRLLRPSRLGWMVVLIVLSLGWRIGLGWLGVNHDEMVFWLDQLPGRLHQFLVGMLAAYGYVRLRASLPMHARLAGVTAGLATAAFLALPALGYIDGSRPYVGGPDGRWFLLPWHLLAAVLVATLLVSLTAAPRRVTQVLASAPLQGLGTISYSFYLWHFPLLAVLREEMGGFSAVRADFASYFIYGGLASLLVATASWWVVERPAQAWSHRVRLPA